MIEKKRPERKCVGCGQMIDKRDLIRVVRDKEGNISFDPTSKKAGRGAYLCRKKVCFDASRKGGRLEKAFKARIPADVYDQLTTQFDEGVVTSE